MKQTQISIAIGRHINKLTEAWMQQVREDNRITSDEELSWRELQDHVPQIIEEICEFIKTGELPDQKNTHEARASVYLRFNQGYRGRDLIRELSLLRLLLFDHLTQVFSTTSELTVADYAQSGRIINLYLDEEMRYAISVYGDLSPVSGNVKN